MSLRKDVTEFLKKIFAPLELKQEDAITKTAFGKLFIAIETVKDSYESEIDQLQVMIDDLATDVHIKENHLTDANKTIAELERVANQKSSEIEELTRELNGLKQKISHSDA